MPCQSLLWKGTGFAADCAVHSECSGGPFYSIPVMGLLDCGKGIIGIHPSICVAFPSFAHYLAGVGIKGVWIRMGLEPARHCEKREK